MSEDEHRTYSRHGVTGRMTYRYAADDRFFEGTCLNISGSGISFECDERIEVGRALEIHIEPENRVMPTLAAFVEVIRNEEMEAGQFLAACVIKGIRGV